MASGSSSTNLIPNTTTADPNSTSAAAGAQRVEPDGPTDIGGGPRPPIGTDDPNSDDFDVTHEENIAKLIAALAGDGTGSHVFGSTETLVRDGTVSEVRDGFGAVATAEPMETIEAQQNTTSRILLTQGEQPSHPLPRQVQYNSINSAPLSGRIHMSPYPDSLSVTPVGDTDDAVRIKNNDLALKSANSRARGKGSMVSNIMDVYETTIINATQASCLYHLVMVRIAILMLESGAVPDDVPFVPYDVRFVNMEDAPAQMEGNYGRVAIYIPSDMGESAVGAFLALHVSGGLGSYRWRYPNAPELEPLAAKYLYGGGHSEIFAVTEQGQARRYNNIPIGGNALTLRGCRSLLEFYNSKVGLADASPLAWRSAASIVYGYAPTLDSDDNVAGEGASFTDITTATRVGAGALRRVEQLYRQGPVVPDDDRPPPMVFAGNHDFAPADDDVFHALERGGLLAHFLRRNFPARRAAQGPPAVAAETQEEHTARLNAVRYNEFVLGNQGDDEEEEPARVQPDPQGIRLQPELVGPDGGDAEAGVLVVPMGAIRAAIGLATDFDLDPVVLQACRGMARGLRLALRDWVGEHDPDALLPPDEPVNDPAPANFKNIYGQLISREFRPGFPAFRRDGFYALLANIAKRGKKLVLRNTAGVSKDTARLGAAHRYASGLHYLYNYGLFRNGYVPIVMSHSHPLDGHRAMREVPLVWRSTFIPAMETGDERRGPGLECYEHGTVVPTTASDVVPFVGFKVEGAYNVGIGGQLTVAAHLTSAQLATIDAVARYLLADNGQLNFVTTRGAQHRFVRLRTGVGGQDERWLVHPFGVPRHTTGPGNLVRATVIDSRDQLLRAGVTSALPAIRTG